MNNQTDTIIEILNALNKNALGNRMEAPAPTPDEALWARLRAAIKAGGYANTVDKCGYTALHYAVIFGNEDDVKFLLQHGADVNKPGVEGEFNWRPLHWAAVCNNSKIIPLLAQRGAWVDAMDSTDDTPLMLACGNHGRGEDVVNSEGNTDTIAALLDAGANIYSGNKNHKTPLNRVIDGNNTAGLGVILDKKPGSIKRHRALFKRMLDRAIQHEHIDIVTMLLDRGADVNQPDEFGVTSLHVAAGCNNFDIFRLLEERGADLHAVDAQGASVLHRAARCGYGDLIPYIISKGVDVNCKTTNGMTPLHCAASGGNYTAAEQLLYLGAEQNAVDKNGNTPLHCVGGKPISGIPGMPAPENIVLSLVNSGADVTIRNACGETPVDRAARYGRKGVVKKMLAADVPTNALHLRNALVHMYASREPMVSSATRTAILELVLSAEPSIIGADEQDNHLIHELCMASAPEDDLKVLMRKHERADHTFAQNKSGDTFLMSYLKYHNDPSVSGLNMFLYYGANPHWRDKEGLDAYQALRDRSDYDNLPEPLVEKVRSQSLVSMPVAFQALDGDRDNAPGSVTGPG